MLLLLLLHWLPPDLCLLAFPQLTGPATEHEIAQFLSTCKPSLNKHVDGGWYWSVASLER